MAKTLQNLRDAVRNEIRDPDGIYFEDAIIDQNINEAYLETYNQIASKLKDYFIDVSTSDIVANQREYPFPSATTRIKKIELVISGRWIPLQRYIRGYADNFDVSGTSFTPGTCIPTYDIEGELIVLEPTPTSGLTNALRITRTLDATELVDVTDEVNEQFKDFWCTLVVLRAANTCFTQIEALGGVVSLTNFLERLSRKEREVLSSISFRSTSVQHKRRKGYFQ